MKLKPVRADPEAEYPEYEEYQTDRRRLLRWLAAGGAAVAAGGLMGCDRVRQVLGLEPDPPPMAGEIACPRPPQPTGSTAADGDETSGDGGGSGDGADEDARPEGHVRGKIAAPDPATDTATTGDAASTDAGTSAGGSTTSGDSTSTGSTGTSTTSSSSETHSPKGRTMGRIRAPSSPRAPKK